MRLCWICILAFLTLTYAYPLRIRFDLDKGDGSDLEQAIYDEALDDIALDPNIADALDAYDNANGLTPPDQNPTNDAAAGADSNDVDDVGNIADVVADAADYVTDNVADSDEAYADDNADSNAVADLPYQVNPTPPVVAVVYVPKPLAEQYGKLNPLPDVAALAGAQPVVIPANAAVPVALLPGQAPGQQGIPAAPVQPIPADSPENYITDTSTPPQAIPGQVPDQQSQTGPPQSPEDDINASQSKDDSEGGSSNPLSGLLQGLSNGISGLVQGLQGIAGTGKTDPVPDDDASPVEQPLLPQ
ncbi:hypothetical protein EV175_000933 [Coemansia sp. RSA 1933]|nr:hypothetical protein EV175_000933 [Coemansia sp. RSA 1933]